MTESDLEIGSFSLKNLPFSYHNTLSPALSPEPNLSHWPAQGELTCSEHLLHTRCFAAIISFKVATLGSGHLEETEAEGRKVVRGHTHASGQGRVCAGVPGPLFPATLFPSWVDIHLS